MDCNSDENGGKGARGPRPNRRIATPEESAQSICERSHHWCCVLPWWGGRPRPRRTPWSGMVNWPKRPTWASAADQEVRPTLLFFIARLFFIRLDRSRDHVLFTSPIPQIDYLAALAAKGIELPFRASFLLANRAFHRAAASIGNISGSS